MVAPGGLRALCYLLVPLSCACSASKASAQLPPQSPPRSLELCLVSGASLNGGGVVHVVVRKTSAVDFDKVSYEDIVATLSQPDPETLHWVQVLPDRATALSVARAAHNDTWATREAESVGIYFLFAKREGPWKARIGPEVPFTSFVLGSNGIEAEDRRRWRCQ